MFGIMPLMILLTNISTVIRQKQAIAFSKLIEASNSLRFNSANSCTFSDASPTFLIY